MSTKQCGHCHRHSMFHGKSDVSIDPKPNFIQQNDPFVPFDCKKTPSLFQILASNKIAHFMSIISLTILSLKSSLHFFAAVLLQHYPISFCLCLSVKSSFALTLMILDSFFHSVEKDINHHQYLKPFMMKYECCEIKKK